MEHNQTAVSRVGHEGDLQIEPSKHGPPTLKYIADNQELYIHSRYSPGTEAERWADFFYEKDKKLFVILGAGLGYQAKALLSRMGEKQKLLLVEPVREIYDLAKRSGGTDDLFRDERVIFYCSDDYMETRNVLLNILRAGLMADYKLHIFPAYKKIFKSQIDEVLKILEELLRFEQININTVKFFARQWQENYFRNLSSALKSQPFLKFKNRFDLPVIIVSAGPSLACELPYLKSLYNKAVIIAAGSAVTTLNKNGIKPHIIISVDGGVQNYRHFQQVDYEDVPLFYSPEINYRILEEYKGPRVIFQFPHEGLYGWYNNILGFETGTAVAGLSVANVALDVALQISRGTVCFIGQDLGYTGGYSHAEGNINRKSLQDFREKGRALIEIEANDGSKLWTDYVYFDMKSWFENYLVCHERNDIYNATLKGAKIKGMVPIKFTDFIAAYCIAEHDIAGDIKKMLSENCVCRNTESAEYLLKTVGELEELKALTFTGKKTAEKLLDAVKNKKTQKITKLLAKMDKIDTKIKEIENKDIYLYFIRQPLLIKINFSVTEKVENDDRIKIAERNCFFYESLHNITGNTIEMLTSQLKILE